MSYDVEGMKEMHIAILDDVLADRQSLYSIVQRYFEERSLQVWMKTYEDGETLLREYHEQNFDLMFLDIFMEGKNGMEIAHELRARNYQGSLIFTTSSKEYAVEGYEVQAMNYLLKPVSEASVFHVLNRCEHVCRQAKNYIVVKEGRLMVKILLNTILYTDYYNHYIQIHTKEHTYRTYLSFADFSELLKGYPQFISCYRNMIVNMDHVETIDHQDFVLKDGCRVPITKAKRQEVRQRYADYLFDKLKG